MLQSSSENQDRSLQIFGTRGSSTAYALRDFLHRSDVPFDWIELVTDEQNRNLANVSGLHDERLPVCCFQMALSTIEVLPHTEVTELHGDDVLQAITLTNNQTGQRQTIETCWLFLCLGGKPHTEWASAVGIVATKRTISSLGQICSDTVSSGINGPSIGTHTTWKRARPVFSRPAMSATVL